jgi:hypothetical protein
MERRDAPESCSASLSCDGVLRRTGSFRYSTLINLMITRPPGAGAPWECENIEQCGRRPGSESDAAAPVPEGGGVRPGMPGFILSRQPQAVAVNPAKRSRQNEKARCKERAFRCYAGDHLISHTLSRAVPSAQRVLTSVFGMGTGGTLAVWSPAKLSDAWRVVSPAADGSGRFLHRAAHRLTGVTT